MIINSGIAILAALAIAGCSADDEGSGSETGVTATTTQVADLARNVAGERAEVTELMSANSDPHDYEPAPSDAEALIETDLILESGGDLDGWADQLVESSGSDAPRLVLLDEAEAVAGEHRHDHAGEELDPHWWQNPLNAILAVEAIRDELIAVDPEGRDEYERNAASYIEQLRRLDREIESCVRSIPGEQRKLVTSHDSLGYFAERYDVEIVGAAIPALSTQAQPSVGETAELVDLIRRTGVKAVFPEAGVSGELEGAIAEEAGASVGGELWVDTLGPEGSGAETYVAAMAQNAATLTEGLTGGAEECAIDAGG